MHELPRRCHYAAEGLDDRLVPQADPESRRAARKPPDDLRGRAGVGGAASAWRDRDVRAACVGAGEIARGEGASRAAAAPSIASLRRTLTSAPSSPKRCARLYVN